MALESKPLFHPEVIRQQVRSFNLPERVGHWQPKLQHWAAAHDLVSESVQPAVGSKWSAPARELPELADPRPYVDLVLDDEFPLSIFYTALKAKLPA